MLKNIVSSCKYLISDIENILNSIITRNSIHPGLCVLPLNAQKRTDERSKPIIDILKDAFLFAVPKSRRSLEKRQKRKYGWPEYHWKLLVPKTNILECTNCGHDYLAGHLCGNCYEKVKKETEEMQKAIEATLKLDPIEKEVVVLYEDELNDKNQEFWQGKRIVEMKKKRPAWFSDNLLQKSTIGGDSETKDKKPSSDELA